MEQEIFKIDLPSVKSFLREYLYPDSRVAFRELIANATNSLNRRYPSPDVEHDTPSIQISMNHLNRSISIRYNGLGMTREEIDDALSTLTTSLTRLPLEDWKESKAFLASLSDGSCERWFFPSLTFCRGIEIKTRRGGNAEKALRWRCGGELTFLGYTLEEIDWDDYGTEVTLYLLPEFQDSRFLSAKALKQIIRKYALFVGYPIYVGENEEPVNCVHVPWKSEVNPTAETYINFLHEFGYLNTPDDALTVIPIEWDEQLSGVLFLPVEAQEEGKVALYVNHLYVNTSADYIETPLNFAHGIVDCQHLPLTPNREGVVKGAEFEKLQNRLKGIVLAHIADLRIEREQTFRSLLSVYGRHLSEAEQQDETALHLISDETTPREKRLAQKADRLRDQLASLRKDNAQLASEKGTLKRVNLKLSAESKELSSQLEKRRTSASATPSHDLKRENQKLLKENRKLKYDQDKKADKLQRLEEEIRQLRAELETDKKQLERITASKAEEDKRWEKRLKEALKEAENAKRLAEFREGLLKKTSQKPLPEKPRVGLFVDGENMRHGARDEYGGALDYAKLLHFAETQRIVRKAIVYVVETAEGDSEDFIAFLKQTGYEVKCKTRKFRADGSSKGDWDVGIAMDIVSMLDELDIVTLASGDGDFAPLGDLIRANGRYLEVMAFPQSTAAELMQAADAFIDIRADMMV